MNYLGIDYGVKKIGLSKAESDLRLATPLRTIPNSEAIFDDINEIIMEEEIEEIVLGLPTSFDGKENKWAQVVKNFGQKLGRQTKVKINFQNELLSTAQAKRSSPKDIDASSAALILQAFLDSN